MLLVLYNTTMASGNPSSLTSILPGGTTGVVTAGTTPTPFLGFPKLECMEYDVLDATTTNGLATPALSGNVLAWNPLLASNNGAALWTIPSQPFSPYGTGQYGIVIKPGSTLAIDENPAGSGVGATVVFQGPCQALCIAPTAGGAIAAGTYLGTDGSGNLEPFQPPSGAPTPTVTPTGGSATTWTYALVAIGANGTYSALGSTGSTAAGAATLTVSAYNTITWTPVADAVGYLIVRTVAGTSPNTVGTIGQVSGDTDSFVDNGLAILTGTSATQPIETLTTGPTPTITNGGTAGSTSYSYRVTGVAPNGVWGIQSSAGSTSTGNATLSLTNYNIVKWTVQAGASQYVIQRSASSGTPSSTGFIGYASVAQATSGFNDYGIAGTTYTQNTTPTPNPANGATLARAIGTLVAGTTTPTLTWVFVAQY
jgi:hypothetical protein